MARRSPSVFELVQAARERLRGHANVTPVMTSRTLDSQAGARVYLKCESFQRSGAFKFRGAFNAMSRLSVEERSRGVITFSSGNHAQAVALVGRLLGVRTTVVMPRDASVSKRAAAEGYGAFVVDYDPRETTREALARSLQAEHGYTMVPPFDHLDVIAGQGTAAAELLEEVGPLDLLLVPCGGGGLLSGSAVAAKGLHPSCRVFGVEPERADDAARSFRSKTLQRAEAPDTIADGTRTPSLGRIPFSLILEHVDGMATVSEDDIREAVRFLFYRMKLVVEPSGALGVAAILARAVAPRGQVGVLVSGGNVDGQTMAQILGA